jgi:1,4-dihydroxy-2-naphthoyl-CoA hydrolase
MTEDYDLTELLNANPEGWNEAMSLRFRKATADEVVAELEVGPQHLQAYGVVHGGVHCGVVETTCSIGAWVWARQFKLAVVGVENHTSFLQAVRSGTRLEATSRPVSRDRRTQVWDANIIDERGRLIAWGRVRLLCLPEERELAGERLGSPLAWLYGHPGDREVAR